MEKIYAASALFGFGFFLYLFLFGMYNDDLRKKYKLGTLFTAALGWGVFAFLASFALFFLISVILG